MKKMRKLESLFTSENARQTMRYRHFFSTLHTFFSLQYFHQGLLTVTLMMFLAAMFPKIDRRGRRAISLFFHLHEHFANPLVLPTTVLVLITSRHSGNIPLQLLRRIKTLLCHLFRPNRHPFRNLC